MGRSDTELQRVHRAVQRGEYRGAIATAAALPFDNLKQAELSHLMDALLTAAGALADASKLELQAYDLVITIGDRLLKKKSYKPAISLRVNSALFNKGVVMAQLGRGEEAIACYDELVKRTGGARDRGLQEAAVRALFNKGARLSGMARKEEAIAAYDELIQRFAGEQSPGLREAVAKALVNKGIALAELDRVAEAVAVLDDVATRWSASPDPTLRERASKALLNKASALIQLGQRELALQAYQEIMARFGQESEPVLREQVEIARFRKEALEQTLN